MCSCVNISGHSSCGSKKLFNWLSQWLEPQNLALKCENVRKTKMTACQSTNLESCGFLKLATVVTFSELHLFARWRCYGPVLISLSQLNIWVCQKCYILMTQINLFHVISLICWVIIITSVLTRNKPIKNSTNFLSEHATTDTPPPHHHRHGNTSRMQTQERHLISLHSDLAL